ncbi:hypothetical protein D6C84_05180 [Aureobasidium pullulans]|uniref:Uncharacterized protein n=1 Tax=Aureobasidium pullulans TaxID=5580 RepID=A0A4S9XSX4_AURPU|nr:hypothetical protein D6C84_05180 [Aureobasidium pullulans]
MPRFLLSWSFPVNEDIWLIAGKEKTASWYEGAKDPEKEVKGKRFLALTGMLANVLPTHAQMAILEQFAIG